MEPQQYFLDQSTGISYAIVPEVDTMSVNIYIAFLTMIYNRYLKDIIVHLHRWIEYVEIIICISHCHYKSQKYIIYNVRKLENWNV